MGSLTFSEHGKKSWLGWGAVERGPEVQLVSRSTACHSNPYRSPWEMLGSGKELLRLFPWLMIRALPLAVTISREVSSLRRGWSLNIKS